MGSRKVCGQLPTSSSTSASSSSPPPADANSSGNSQLHTADVPGRNWQNLWVADILLHVRGFGGINLLRVLVGIGLDPQTLVTCCHFNKIHTITNVVAVSTLKSEVLWMLGKCRKRVQRWRKRAQSGQLPSACQKHPNPTTRTRTRAESVSGGKEGRGGGSAFGSWSLLACLHHGTNKAVFKSGQRWRKWI